MLSYASFAYKNRGEAFLSLKHQSFEARKGRPWGARCVPSSHGAPQHLLPPSPSLVSPLQSPFASLLNSTSLLSCLLLISSKLIPSLPFYVLISPPSPPPPPPLPPPPLPFCSPPCSYVLFFFITSFPLIRVLDLLLILFYFFFLLFIFFLLILRQVFIYFSPF